MPKIFVNPQLPNYFFSADGVTSGQHARSYVEEYEDSKVVFFPDLKLRIDHDFWASLDSDACPALKKFSMDLSPSFDNLKQHKENLLLRGADANLAGAICEQIQTIYDQLIPVYQAVFADYEFVRRKVMWRLNTIMAENMHIDTYKDEVEHHFARMFVNLDSQPRIWHTSWRVEDMVEMARGKFAPEELEGLSRGQVWAKLSTHFFGKSSRQWWDDQPRHIAFFAPGDVWAVDSRQVAHQIFYGRRALSIDFYVPRERMRNPDLHYLQIADRFRIENRAAVAA